MTGTDATMRRPRVVRPLRAVRLLLLVLSGGIAGPAGAATLRVPADVPSIGAGLAAASTGDTVLVSCGIYAEHGLVVGAGVTLRGENGDAGCVTIDALGQGRILDVGAGPGQAAIEGLTLRGGFVAGGFLEALGGGVRCLGGEVRVADCHFAANTAVIGGGFGAEQAHVELVRCTFDGNAAADTAWAAGGGVWVRDSAGLVDACVFTANTAFATNPADPGDGGGMFVNGSRLAISDCEFRGNSTAAGAGGLYTVSADTSSVERCLFTGNLARWGGGLYVENAATRFTDCIVENNTADAGGGMTIGRQAAPVFDACVFRGNSASVGSGGGIDCWQSWPELQACLFAANEAATHGGGMHCGGARPVLHDCIFLANTAGVRGGGLSGSYANIRLTGCSLAGNGAPSGGGVSSATSSFATLTRTLVVFAPEGGALHQTASFAYTINASDIFGNAGGDWTGAVADLLGQDGNISADPLFCGYETGDLHLDAASPCAPPVAGEAPIGAFGVGCALSAVAPPREHGIVVEGNVPNPFNPATVIRFRLPLAATTRVTVHDVAGRLVRVLVDAPLAHGRHEIRWDGHDDGGRTVAAGTYFYRVTSGRSSAAGRMTLVK